MTFQPMAELISQTSAAVKFGSTLFFSNMEHRAIGDTDPPLAEWRNKERFLNKIFLSPLYFILLTLYLLKRLGGTNTILLN